MPSTLHEVLLKLTKPMSSTEASEYINKKHPNENRDTVNMGEDYLDNVAIEHLKLKQKENNS